MDQLVTLFAQVLGVPPETINEETSPETVASWDSLAATELVVAIEEAFSVKLSTRDIMSMRSVGRAREALRKKGVAGL